MPVAGEHCGIDRIASGLHHLPRLPRSDIAYGNARCGCSVPCVVRGCQVSRALLRATCAAPVANGFLLLLSSGGLHFARLAGQGRSQVPPTSQCHGQDQIFFQLRRGQSGALCRFVAASGQVAHPGVSNTLSHSALHCPGGQARANVRIFEADVVTLTNV